LRGVALENSGKANSQEFMLSNPRFFGKYQKAKPQEMKVGNPPWPYLVFLQVYRQNYEMRSAGNMA
jgi:hypothetical protein